MKISYIKYSLKLKHRFTISHSSRTETPIVLVKVEQNGITGFGEASLPPYLKETQDSVCEFLSEIKLRDIHSVEDLTELNMEIKSLSQNDCAAKAAVNIALNDLLGKIFGIPVYKLYGIKNRIEPAFTSFTIGIDDEKTLREKIGEAKDYKILKIKLGTENDEQIIKVIREETGKPLYIDANQGWKDKNRAYEMIEFLNEQNVLFIEQPMPVNLLDDARWLKEKSLLPIIADEAFQTYDDLEKIKDSYHGINIKLMKCGGINEALKIIQNAKLLDLKIMLGCMTETSCAISAAAQIAPLADYLDLDGNLLISNDPFERDSSKNGIIEFTDLPGLGISEKEVIFK